MKTRLIGDIHGMFVNYKEIAEGAEKSIQIGDFGIGFNNSLWHENVNEFHATGDHRFIRGNHDHPTMCRTEMAGYISDGTIENDIMFIGGAWSIDQMYRREGSDWWADEELSIEELNMMIDVYTTTRPRIMITHDFPTSIASTLFLSKYDKQYKTRTAEAFEQMLQIHQPELWVAGHWHMSVDKKINNTRFICLNELEYLDIDLGD